MTFRDDLLSSNSFPSLEGEVTGCLRRCLDLEELKAREFLKGGLLLLASSSSLSYNLGDVWVSLLDCFVFLSLSKNSLESPLRVLGTIN